MIGINKQIKIGAALSYISIAFNIIVGFIYTPWMIEKIGKGDYGLYTLANSLITLFLVDFGLGSAVSRYISKYRAEGRQDKIDNFLGIVYKLYLILDVVILGALIILFFFIERIYVTLTLEELEKFKVVYLMSASFAIINFPFVTLNGILNSYEEFIHLKLADIMYRVMFVVCTIVALLIGYGLYALVAVHAFVGLIIIAYKLLVIKKRVRVNTNYRYSDMSLLKDIFSFSIWVTISTLSQRMVFNITPSILGAVASSTAIAVFGIVVTIEGYAYTITTAINGMFMPKISRIYERGEEDEKLMPLLINVGKFQYSLNGLIIAGFTVLGKEFIELWIGSTYSDAYYGVILVIIPGLFFNSLQIANTAMVVRKKVNFQAWVNLGMGILNVCVSIFLSKIYGVVGSCISIFIAYMFRALTLLVVYHKVLKLNMIKFAENCYLRLGIPIVFTIGIGIIVNHVLIGVGWLGLCIKGVIVASIYFINMLFLGFDNNDRKLLFGLIRRRDNNHGTFC